MTNNEQGSETDFEASVLRDLAQLDTMVVDVIRLDDLAREVRACLLNEGYEF